MLSEALRKAGYAAEPTNKPAALRKSRRENFLASLLANMNCSLNI
jgi:hypothetical protein